MAVLTPSLTRASTPGCEPTSSHAAERTTAERTQLQDGGWHERKTAAWFIAVSGRSRFRDKLGELLLASEGPKAGRAYCTNANELRRPEAHTAGLTAKMSAYADERRSARSDSVSRGLPQLGRRWAAEDMGWHRWA